MPVLAEQREALALRHANRVTMQELADCLSCSVPTARSRLRAAARSFAFKSSFSLSSVAEDALAAASSFLTFSISSSIARVDASPPRAFISATSRSHAMSSRPSNTPAGSVSSALSWR